ncbi:MAG: tRNA (N6-isopentenyl adenosine(37)-C2)-methylthiotransferase MiaB [Sedimentisphaeraceae bacterium JB056]
MKLFIKSFGCQMNKLDTGLVSSAFQEAGYELTDNEDDADLVFMNTCSVRENAEKRVLSRLGYFKHLKKTKPDLIVGVIGCMAQRLGDELLKNEAVDIVCGPSQIPNLRQIVDDFKEKHQKIATVSADIRSKPEETEQKTLDNFEFAYDSDQENIKGQAFVRVMRGCNNFCSYCIVPYVRGPEVSRPPQQILQQIRKLTETGVRQVTLLGQTVNSYSYTENGKTYMLGDLLEMIAEIDQIKWIRFITSYPNLKYDEPLFKAMGQIEKVSPYLHMPAQSGSNNILKAMNRKYTAEQYLDMLALARDYVPDIAIASDFIVGFPGETDQDYQQTVELVQKAFYKNIFVFKYSPRPGTKTDRKLEDSVPEEVKKERNNHLLGIQEPISGRFNEQFMGKTVEVMVEGLSKKPHLNNADGLNNPQLIGRTSQDGIVVFNGPESLSGSFAKVKINKTAPLTLFGELEGY